MESKIIIPKDLSVADILILVGHLIKKREELHNDGSADVKPNILSTKDICQQFPFLKPHTLNEAVRRKELKVIKIGKLNYYDIDDILNFIESRKSYNNDVSKSNIKSGNYV